MKRTLSLMLGILMIFSVFCITAGAAKEKTFEDFKYLVTDKTGVTVTKYTGTEAQVTVPAKIGGKNVTAIGDKAFSNNSTVKKVTISEGVKSIGLYAFYYCGNLESVKLPKTLESIDAYAFVACKKLEKIDLPKNLSKLGVNVFTSCSALKEITVPKKITAIPDATFENCTSLKKVSLPDSLTRIDYAAFMECSSLKFIKLPSKLSFIGNNAFSGCTALKAIFLPDSVTEIDQWAFNCCSALKSVALSSNLKTIGIGAFEKCTALKNIHIPKSVRKVCTYAFRDCTKLENISGGKGITEIGDEVFYGTAFAKNKDNWENGALYFGNCLVSLSKNVKGTYKVKEGTTVISNGIFNFCKKLTGVYLPESVTSVAASVKNYLSPCFFSPNLKKIVVSKNSKYFRSVDGILYSKNMKVLYRYPAAKTEKSFSVPKNVKTIWDCAFSGCSSLRKISFHPDSTAVIRSGAFDNCKNLNDITITKGVTVHQYAGFGWYIGKDDDELVKNLKFKGNSSNKSLMNYLNTFGFKDCFVPLCKDGSTKHTLKTAKAKAPTYFSYGYKAFKYCSVCKEKFGVKYIDKKPLPDSVISVAGGKEQMTIKYNAVNKASGFRIFLVEQSTAKEVDKTFGATKSKTVKLTDLNPGTYTVAVRVFQKNGNKTAWSNWSWLSKDGERVVITVK
mgnify:FL=1